MSDRSLTKDKALELITPVVDGEVSEDQRLSFLAFIEKNQRVKALYQSELRLKQRLQSLSRKKAPDRLYQKVEELITEETQADNEASEGPLNMPAQSLESNPGTETSGAERSDRQNIIPIFGLGQKNWAQLSVAAVISIMIIYGIVALFQPQNQQQYPIELYTAKHFSQNQGQLLPASINVTDPEQAEVELLRRYNMALQIPNIKGAEFKGVVDAEFVPGLKTPMLEYHQPGMDETVYIFVFDEYILDKQPMLARNIKAVKSCKQSNDYYVENVQGKHVVSWRWNRVWYTAISNHNGHDLASLVSSLQ